MKNRILAALMLASGFFASAHMAHADDFKNMTVFKTPWCGCCQVWVDAMKEAGYTVKVENMEKLDLIKRQAGVPQSLTACHTAKFGKYILEGHVPLAAIDKLVSEQPDVRGIAVAGMPQGSLGMGYDPNARYQVMSFTYAKTNGTSIFYEAGK